MGVGRISLWIASWLAAHPIKVMEHGRLLIGIGLIFMASNAVFVVVNGVNWGIDFVGGVVVEFTPKPEITVAQVNAAIGQTPTLQHGLAQPLDDGRVIMVRVKGAPGDEAQNVLGANSLVDQIRTTLTPYVAQWLQTDFIGPSVSGDMIVRGIQAVALSLVGIFLYLWVRFRWQFATSACLALIHDLVMVSGFFVITGFEFNLSSVAALLITIGYSVNDTVILFDRVRENLRKFRQRPLNVILDQSINEVLPRTLFTSITTLVALLGVIAFARGVVQEFAYAIVWGIVLGTFSSVAIAAPVLVALGAKRGDEDA